jgi:hypothetical protein
MKTKPLPRGNARGAERDKAKTGKAILSQLPDTFKPIGRLAGEVLTELATRTRVAA